MLDRNTWKPIIAYKLLLVGWNSWKPIIACKLLISDRNIWKLITDCKLLILDRNTWKPITDCKLLVFRIATWTYNFFLQMITWNHITAWKQKKKMKNLILVLNNLSVDILLNQPTIFASFCPWKCYKSQNKQRQFKKKKKNVIKGLNTLNKILNKNIFSMNSFCFKI